MFNRHIVPPFKGFGGQAGTLALRSSDEIGTKEGCFPLFKSFVGHAASSESLPVRQAGASHAGRMAGGEGGLPLLF